MIKIICVGKIKENYLRDAILEYTKRISKYDKLEIIELPDNDSEKSLVIERDLILSKIKEREFVVTLEIEGKEISSVELSDLIDKTYINYPTITFIIGGSYGIHDDVKKRSDYSLSFSKLTFPHQLFRVMLLEQIYRAFKILKNESYHK